MRLWSYMQMLQRRRGKIAFEHPIRQYRFAGVADANHPDSTQTIYVQIHHISFAERKFAVITDVLIARQDQIFRSQRQYIL